MQVEIFLKSRVVCRYIYSILFSYLFRFSLDRFKSWLRFHCSEVYIFFCFCQTCECRTHLRNEKKVESCQKETKIGSRDKFSPSTKLNVVIFACKCMHKRDTRSRVPALMMLHALDQISKIRCHSLLMNMCKLKSDTPTIATSLLYSQLSVRLFSPSDICKKLSHQFLLHFPIGIGFYDHHAKYQSVINRPYCKSCLNPRKNFILTQKCITSCNSNNQAQK